MLNAALEMPAWKNIFWNLSTQMFFSQTEKEILNLKIAWQKNWKCFLKFWNKNKKVFLKLVHTKIFFGWRNFMFRKFKIKLIKFKKIFFHTFWKMTVMTVIEKFTRVHTNPRLRYLQIWKGTHKSSIPAPRNLKGYTQILDAGALKFAGVHANPWYRYRNQRFACTLWLADHN